MSAPRVAVAVPTRRRAAYLEVALRSLAPQVAAHGARLLVVDDGPDPTTRAAADRWGAAYVDATAGRGLNAARNAAFAAAPEADLVAFVDDDVEVRPGWLAALVAGAVAHPGHEALTGPIAARLERRRPLWFCGREGPPVTAQWHGPEEADVPAAWGANLAVRRAAIERVGRFDEGFRLYGGDEQEWQERLRAAGGRIRWLPGAALDHRRAGRDATLPALARGAWTRGRAGRREDVRRGAAPPLRAEVRVLAGCVAHGPRLGCANGPILTAHALGRLAERVRPAPAPPAEPWLSGRSGHVAGQRGRLRAGADRALDLALAARGRAGAGAARDVPHRRVLVLGVERPGRALSPELRSDWHDVEVATAPPGAAGKFENLNALLEAHPPAGRDWLVVADDDVELPPGFLDRFLALSERYDLRLAQPAHRLHSHAAWPVTRRRPASLARETAFVEIGPVTALHRSTFAALLPFPPLRMGWGLDARWSAIAREHGWRIGVVDATPILHTVPVAGAYGREEALAEARAFLAGQAYVTRDEAARTRWTHR